MVDGEGNVNVEGGGGEEEGGGFGFGFGFGFGLGLGLGLTCWRKVRLSLRLKSGRGSPKGSSVGRWWRGRWKAGRLACQSRNRLRSSAGEKLGMFGPARGCPGIRVWGAWAGCGHFEAVSWGFDRC